MSGLVQWPLAIVTAATSERSGRTSVRLHAHGAARAETTTSAKTRLADVQPVQRRTKAPFLRGR